MLRKPTDEKNPADWFLLAADRLKAADSLWKHEGFTAAGIELLPEALERYLKGYLIAKGWRLIRTHDLEELISDAKTFDPAFAKFVALAEELTEDFFLQHYPGHDMTELGTNYEVMRNQTSELVNLITQSLPKYFPQTDQNK
jgi:HEPN domain-containing protein